MLRRNQRSRRSSTQLPEITLTPLIDTALVLLVIFMVAAPVMHNAINVDLPKGNMQEAQDNKQEPLVVLIDKNNNTYINGVMVERDMFITILEQKIQGKTDVTVRINGDKDCSYGTCAALIDDIKYLAGVEHVVLSTERA